MKLEKGLSKWILLGSNLNPLIFKLHHAPLNILIISDVPDHHIITLHGWPEP